MKATERFERVMINCTAPGMCFEKTEEGAALMRRFQVPSWPHVLFLDPLGEVVDRIRGGCDGDVYLEHLTRIGQKYDPRRRLTELASGERVTELARAAATRGAAAATIAERLRGIVAVEDVRALLVPEPELAEDLLACRETAYAAEVRPEFALALAATALRIKPPPGQEDTAAVLRGRIASVSLEAQADWLRDHGERAMEADWSNTRIVIERVQRASPQAINRQAERVASVRTLIELELRRLTADDAPYRAGAHGFRLAYLVADRGTAGVMLDLLEEFDAVGNKLASRSRLDAVFLDHAVGIALKHGDISQLARLSGLVATRLRSTPDRILEAQLARHAQSLLARDGLDSVTRAALQAALKESSSSH